MKRLAPFLAAALLAACSGGRHDDVVRQSHRCRPPGFRGAGTDVASG